MVKDPRGECMRILIVEDEPVSARLLEDELRRQLGSHVESLRHERTLTGSQCHVWDHAIDLLFLDLDLRGEDGFGLLRAAAAGAFQTIVVSANTHRALEAFHFGVLDFLGKPLDPGRLELALARFKAQELQREGLRYLSVVEDGQVRIVPLDRILYVQADTKRSFLALKDGEKLPHNRSLKQLADLLPAARFTRVHKSFIVPTDMIEGYRNLPGRNHEVVLRGGTTVPASRSAVREFRKHG